VDPDIIDLNDDRPFQESEWIRAGKEYPEKPPQYIENAKNMKFRVPVSYTQYYPKDDTPVLQFIAASLPDISKEIITVNPSTWFCRDSPTTNPVCLLTRPIPKADFLTRLEGISGQAWFNGSKSIVDSRYNDGKDRLPLWTVTFWKAMVDFAVQCDSWKHSMDWLKRVPAMEEDINEVFDVLSDLGWNTKLPYLRGAVTTRLFPAILSNEWLNDDHINIMMEELTQRLQCQAGLENKAMVAPLGLANELARTRGRKQICDRKSTPFLYLYAKRIQQKRIQQLYIPVHVNQNHWIVAYVDLERREVGYGEFESNIVNDIHDSQVYRGFN